MQSPREAAAPRDRPKLAAPAKHLLDLDRRFRYVNRDLMETGANVNEPLAPLRRTDQSRVRHVRQTRVGACACFPDEFQQFDNAAGARSLLVRFGRRKTVAGE